MIYENSERMGRVDAQHSPLIIIRFKIRYFCEAFKALPYFALSNKTAIILLPILTSRTRGQVLYITNIYG